jgi:hypothetical protein
VKASESAKILSAIIELAKHGPLRVRYDEHEPGYGSVTAEVVDSHVHEMTFWTKGPYAGDCFAAGGHGRKIARRMFGPAERWPEHWSEKEVSP